MRSSRTSGTLGAGSRVCRRASRRSEPTSSTRAARGCPSRARRCAPARRASSGSPLRICAAGWWSSRRPCHRAAARPMQWRPCSCRHRRHPSRRSSRRQRGAGPQTPRLHQCHAHRGAPVARARCPGAALPACASLMTSSSSAEGALRPPLFPRSSYRRLQGRRPPLRTASWACRTCLEVTPETSCWAASSLGMSPPATHRRRPASSAAASWRLRPPRRRAWHAAPWALPPLGPRARRRGRPCWPRRPAAPAAREMLAGRTATAAAGAARLCGADCRPPAAAAACGAGACRRPSRAAAGTLPTWAPCQATRSPEARATARAARGRRAATARGGGSPSACPGQSHRSAS
mmetsp:Transcript_6414/g.25955  ORF Transcript_6414/g.25955 Transcript_6414/m.25955 type:complete len:348 (+) Transcript_6414:2273-3316(+)